MQDPESGETRRFSFFCLSSSPDLCLGVSPGPFTDPAEGLLLQIKRYSKNYLKGMESVKMRWDVLMDGFPPTNGTVFSTGELRLEAPFPMYCVDSQPSVSNLRIFPCVNPGITLWTFDHEVGVVRLTSNPILCMTVHRCVSRHDPAQSCVAETSKIEDAPGRLVEGSMVHKNRCFDRGGVMSSRVAQVFTRQLDCVAGCSPGDSVRCEVQCLNPECAAGTGSCTNTPTRMPTVPTTRNPTVPTYLHSPSALPSSSPSASPSRSPSWSPTRVTKKPSRPTTDSPTQALIPASAKPSSRSTSRPSWKPSSSPSLSPTSLNDDGGGGGTIDGGKFDTPPDLQPNYWWVLFIMMLVVIFALYVLRRRRRVRFNRLTDDFDAGSAVALHGASSVPLNSGSMAYKNNSESLVEDGEDARFKTGSAVALNQLRYHSRPAGTSSSSNNSAETIMSTPPATKKRRPTTNNSTFEEVEVGV